MAKDIIVSVNAADGSVYTNARSLGINGENLGGQIIVEFFNGDFVDGNGRLEVEKSDGTKGYLAMTKDADTKTYRLDICSNLLDVVGGIKAQVRIVQEKENEEIPIFKSLVFSLNVLEALNVTKTIPEDSPDWCDTVDERLTALEDSGGVEVVQGTGQSTTDVMSQKAVTDELDKKQDKLNPDVNLLGTDGIEITETEDEKIEVSGKNLIKDPYPGVNVTGASIVNYKPYGSSDWGSAFVRNTHPLVNNAGSGAIVGYDNNGVIYAKTTSDDEWSVVNRKYGDENYLKVYDRGLIGSGEVKIPGMRNTDGTNSQNWYPTCVGQYVANSAIALTDAQGHLGTTTPINDLHCANKKYVDDSVANIDTNSTKYVHNLVLEGIKDGNEYKVFMRVFSNDNSEITDLATVRDSIGQNDDYSCTGYVKEGSNYYSVMSFDGSGPLINYLAGASGVLSIEPTVDDVTITDNPIEF